MRMAGVTRLIRRICLLREQGAAAEAARLEESDLMAAVGELRTVLASDVLSESELRALFSREEQRVTDAAVLSELLIPQLLGRLAVSAPSGPPGVFRPAAAGPALPPVPRAPAAGSPAIPDLLDAMLAAERTNRRPLAPSKRQARTTTRT